MADRGGRNAVNERYARQMVLPQVGQPGQARLQAASVLVVGAGGLGCAVLPYLCAAGVGRLVIVDHDRVEESNLHRQPLYGMCDLDQLKTHAARERLSQMNPEVQIDAVAQRVTPANAAALVTATDIVVDAGDSIALTYVLSDACRRAGKPLVSASALGLSGYVGVFCGGAPSYRAVFPDMPRHASACSEAGVLGSTVGVMGCLQAQMTLALILGLEPSPLGRLISVDLGALRFGGFSFASAQEPAEALPFIAPADLRADDCVVDLRALTEAPRAAAPGALRISVDELAERPPQLDKERRVVLCCRTGVRAWRAARALQDRGYRNLALVALGDP